VPGFRTITLFACICVLAASAQAAPLSGEVPLPRHRPVIKGEKLGKPEAPKRGAQKLEPRGAAPLAIAPSAALTPREVPVAEAPANARLEPPVGQAPILAPPAGAAAPFATTAATATSPLDLSAVKQAIDLVRKNRQGEATDIENTISDPVARKLLEWVILRSEDGSSEFPRYAALLPPIRAGPASRRCGAAPRR